MEQEPETSVYGFIVVVLLLLLSFLCWKVLEFVARR